MNEIWKDIPDFEGLYQVSNTGNVRSFRKSPKFGSPDIYILRPSLASNGYYQVTLYGNGKRRKFTVHRLVASVFLPNPNNYECVNHKDENRLNNAVNNLEWCDIRYNNNYGTASIRATIKKGKTVCQYLPSGEFVAMYASKALASRFTGIHPSLIKDCCNGKSRTAGGYKWSYEKY